MSRILTLLFLMTAFTVKAQRLIIQESWEDNRNRWFTGRDGFHLFRIDSGFYHIETGGVFRQMAFKEPVRGEMYASCRVRLTSYDNTAACGLYFSEEAGNEKPSLFVVLNPAGYYSVFTRKDEKTIPVIRWMPSAYIFKADTFNTISVSGDSLKLNVYINDFPVNSFKPPLYHYRAAGIALFDTCTADFDELILLTYPDTTDKFGIDPLDFKEVLLYLMGQQHFRHLKAKSISDSLSESSLLIPSAREVLLSERKYTAIFSAHESENEARKQLHLLLEKTKKALPGAVVTEGFDDETMPYYLVSRTEGGKPLKPYADIYIFTQETEGKKTFYTALDIEPDN